MGHTRGSTRLQVISLNQCISLFAVVWKPYLFPLDLEGFSGWSGRVEAAVLGAEFFQARWFDSDPSGCSHSAGAVETRVRSGGMDVVLVWNKLSNTSHVLVEQIRRAYDFSQLRRIEMDAGIVLAAYPPLPLTIVKKCSFAPCAPAEIREPEH